MFHTAYLLPPPLVSLHIPLSDHTKKNMCVLSSARFPFLLISLSLSPSPLSLLFSLSPPLFPPLPLSFSPSPSPLLPDWFRYDDVVVGAPMYSQINSESKVLVETGRVYVFINNGVSQDIVPVECAVYACLNKHVFNSLQTWHFKKLTGAQSTAWVNITLLIREKKMRE